MVVGLCDDDRIWCRKAEGILEEYAERGTEDLEIVCFADREDLLAYTGSPLDVLFLDIELCGENGIKVAQEINTKWECCAIVYVTNYISYATDAYDTRHSYYVLKEQFQEKLGRILQIVRSDANQKKRQLIFTSGGRTIFLAPEEIFYFERCGRKTRIETTWGSYEIRERIVEIMERLPKEDFLRCHSSYIVYLPNVQEAEEKLIRMKNGAVIAVSRAYAKETSRAIARWVLSRMV